MTMIANRGLRTACLFQRASTSSYKTFHHISKSRLLSQYRYASSAISKSPLEKENGRSLLNGPLSTHPAPLMLPTRKEHPTAFKYYLNLGKAFASFYKTGVKNIYYNFRASQPIQTSIDKSYPPTRISHQQALTAAISDNALTRSDFQLLRRNWHDLKRVPLFGLVFLICGEFTPLVVIALSNIVPWTCRIPKQILNDRKKLEKRREVSFRNLTIPPPTSPTSPTLVRMQLLHISWSLGLSSSIWDYLGGQLPGLPTFLLRRKVANRVWYLEMDDKLLGSGSRVHELDIEELKIALVERGVDVLGRKEESMRKDLEKWLTAREGGESVERLLLTRPNVWPAKPHTTRTNKPHKISLAKNNTRKQSS